MKGRFIFGFLQLFIELVNLGLCLGLSGCASIGMTVGRSGIGEGAVAVEGLESF